MRRQTHSIKLPGDLSGVKSKAVFGLTLRQLLFIAIGVGIAFPLFFGLRKILPQDIAVVIAVLIMMPTFVIAIYDKLDRYHRPLEKVIFNYVRANWLRQKIRPYKTNNYYSAAERAFAARKEIMDIVRTQEKKK